MSMGLLGADVGGTFTDFVYTAPHEGTTISFKVPSTPDEPARAVIDGLRQLVSEFGVDLATIGSFIHGTTIGANTLIQRAGVTTGLLVTSGFRDVLEIGRLRLTDPTNYQVEKTTPIVPRRLVREINERMLASGDVLHPLDTAELHATVQDLIDDGVEALAVSFMHAYANPAHEQQAIDYITASFPDLYACRSSQVWPQQREFERTLVTAINAYVGRPMSDYFTYLEGEAAKEGLQAPVLTTKSNGGIMAVTAARNAPVETLLSGPASGVVAALHIGRQSGHDKLLAFDMGGTSAEIAVIDGDVMYSTESSVGDFPVIVPAIDVSSFGAGGGSVAWVDSTGLLKVGPRSAGAAPGPACYGRGGTEATATDAYVRLGIINPGTFLGGRMTIDAGLADAALEAIGQQIGKDTRETALGILDVMTANMHAQLMPLLARRGVDPADFALLAYGGAGPTHAFLVAREIGVGTVIVPPTPGTLCALGCLVADVKQDSIKTMRVRTDEIDAAALSEEFERLGGAGVAWLEQQGVACEEVSIVKSADMRYDGQAFDITVPLDSGDAGTVSPAEARSRFDEAYEKIYGMTDPGAPVEVVNIRVTTVGVTPRPAEVATVAGPRDGSDGSALLGTREIWEGDHSVVADVYARTSLQPGFEFSGPAIVEADDTTVYVPSGYQVTVDPSYSLIGRAVA